MLAAATMQTTPKMICSHRFEDGTGRSGAVVDSAMSVLPRSCTDMKACWVGLAFSAGEAPVQVVAIPHSAHRIRGAISSWALVCIIWYASDAGKRNNAKSRMKVTTRTDEKLGTPGKSAESGRLGRKGGIPKGSIGTIVRSARGRMSDNSVLRRLGQWSDSSCGNLSKTFVDDPTDCPLRCLGRAIAEARSRSCMAKPIRPRAGAVLA
jgi:hypothetical protein